MHREHGQEEDMEPDGEVSFPQPQSLETLDKRRIFSLKFNFSYLKTSPSSLTLKRKCSVCRGVSRASPVR